MGADCPRLLPTLAVDVLTDVSKAVVYRALVPAGSLRDLMHLVTDPLQPHSAKYGRLIVDEAMGSSTSVSSPGRGALVDTGSPSARRAMLTTSIGRSGATGGGAKRTVAPLPPHLISKCGREILEGLLALRCLGLPCPHLHSGNVFVHFDASGQPSCRISDFELAILHVPAASRNLAKPRPLPGRPLPSIEVIAFGHLLYEMLTGGAELTRAALDGLASRAATARYLAPAAAWNVVREIFLPAEVSTNGTEPTHAARARSSTVDIDYLVHDDFFARAEGVQQPAVSSAVPATAMNSRPSARAARQSVPDPEARAPLLPSGDGNFGTRSLPGTAGGNLGTRAPAEITPALIDGSCQEQPPQPAVPPPADRSFSPYSLASLATSLCVGARFRAGAKVRVRARVRCWTLCSLAPLATSLYVGGCSANCTTCTSSPCQSSPPGFLSPLLTCLLPFRPRDKDQSDLLKDARTFYAPATPPTVPACASVAAAAAAMAAVVAGAASVATTNGRGGEGAAAEVGLQAVNVDSVLGAESTQLAQEADVAAAKAAAYKAAAEKAAVERAAVERATAETVAKAKAKAERAAVEKAAAEEAVERAAVAERAAAERVAVMRAAAEAAAVERAAAAERAAAEAVKVAERSSLAEAAQEAQAATATSNGVEPHGRPPNPPMSEERVVSDDSSIQTASTAAATCSSATAADMPTASPSHRSPSPLSSPLPSPLRGAQSEPSLSGLEARDLEARLLKLPNKNRPSDYR